MIGRDPRRRPGWRRTVTTIEVPRKVAELNHMAIAVAERPTRERQLVLRGELAIDPKNDSRSRAFPGNHR